MKKNQVYDGKVLKELRRIFLRQRRRHGRAYPEELRRLVRKAREQGHSVSALAAATGVSDQGLRNWLSGVDASGAGHEPVELKLVDSPRASELIEPYLEAAGSLVVTIRFRSGASLELPLSRLDAAMVSALNGSSS